MKNALSTVALGTLVALGSFGANAAIEEGQLTIWINGDKGYNGLAEVCLLYTSPSPRDRYGSRMPSSA